MKVTFRFFWTNRKIIPFRLWRKMIMAAGVGALQSALGRVKRKLPNPNKKISVVYMNKDGSVDWPPEELMNRNGVLIIPAPLTESEWELDDEIDA